MSLANNIRGWRLSLQQSVAVIAAKAGIPPDTLEAIESGEQDPSASMVEALASAIGIPAAWLYSDPKHLELLIEDDEDRNAAVSGGLDPVRERVLLGAREDVELYVLLTAILQSGEPKLRLAAEASLRSLAKQAKQPTVPWQSRPPGHFEPPSD